MKKLFSIGALLCVQFGCCNSISAQPLETVLVLIDEKTEDKLGEFPYQRDVLAKGLYKLFQLGAKEVLLKFFLDQAKGESGDKSLVDALSTMPVTLQARIDNNEPNPNILIKKFTLNQQFENLSSADGGVSGWLPLEIFSEQAKAVGFINRIYPVQLIQIYQNKLVGSLYFHAIESIFNQKLNVKGGKLYIGD